MAEAAHNNLQVGISNRQILSIAIPISFGILVPQLNFITNNIFLGRLSEQSLAAGAITGVYYLIFAAIGFGLNNGLQALISRRAGENRPQEIGKLFTQGVAVAMGIAYESSLPIHYLIVLKFSLHDDTIRQPRRFHLSTHMGLAFPVYLPDANALLVGTNQANTSLPVLSLKRCNVFDY